jgi:hypothetical protein
MKFLNTCAFLACGLVAISMGFSTLAVASEPGSDAAIEKEEEKEQITSSRVWPPRYQDRRFKEDWAPVDWTMDRSALPWYDRIKVVPLTKDNSIWASFGGQARFRSVILGSPDFGNTSTKTADSQMLRIRTNGDLHIGDRTRIYIEGIYSDSSTQINGENLPGLKTDNSPQFLNLFGEYDITADADGSAGLWLGRRELQFGRQRLVSSQNWLNSRKAFEGLGGWKLVGDARISAFLTQPVVVVPEGRNTRDKDTTFWGLVYANREETVPVAAEFARALTRPTHGFYEPYLYGLHRKDVTVVQGTGDEDRYSIGLLSYGPYTGTPFDAEAEFTAQFGKFDGGDLLAWALALQGGISPSNWRLKPRFWVSLDYASGDEDADDNTLGTFDPMYPLSQAFFGMHGLIDRRNLISTSVNSDLMLAPKWMLRLSAYSMWRAETGDGVYRTNGTILRRPSGSDERHIGFQTQLITGYQLNRNILLVGAATWLSPGDFFADTQESPTKQMWLLNFAAQWTF